MVTLAQRIEELRTARGLSRPALAAALGFPRTAIEKFETGRQTPTQDQQNKLASYFRRVPLLSPGRDQRHHPDVRLDGTGRFWTSPPRFRPPRAA